MGAVEYRVVSSELIAIDFVGIGVLVRLDVGSGGLEDIGPFVEVANRMGQIPSVIVSALADANGVISLTIRFVFFTNRAGSFWE